MGTKQLERKKVVRIHKLNARQPVAHDYGETQLGNAINRINQKILLERSRVASGYKTGHKQKDMTAPLVECDSPYKRKA